MVVFHPDQLQGQWCWWYAGMGWLSYSDYVQPYINVETTLGKVLVDF